MHYGMVPPSQPALPKNVIISAVLQQNVYHQAANQVILK
jgi:hypothetical protein